MSDILTTCRDLLSSRPELSELQQNEEAVFALLRSESGAHTLLCLDDGEHVRLVVELMPLDQLNEDNVSALFSWSKDLQLARVVGQQNGLWLRLEVPGGEALQAQELNHRLDRALDILNGFAAQDASRVTTARPLACATPADKGAVEMALQLFGYKPEWQDGLGAWALFDPKERLNRPIVAFWDEDAAVLSLVFGVHPMSAEQVDPNLAWNLMQVNDRLRLSRYGFVEGLGLVTCVDIPKHLAARPVPWVEALIEDTLTGASMMSPDDNDLASKVQLTRQWITHTCAEDGVTMTQVLDGVLAAFRGEEPPALGRNPLWPDVLHEFAKLVHDIAQTQPQALAMLAMTRDMAENPEAVENLWALLEGYAAG